jgi:hypothetical protein
MPKPQPHEQGEQLQRLESEGNLFPSGHESAGCVVASSSLVIVRLQHTTKSFKSDLDFKDFSSVNVRSLRIGRPSFFLRERTGGLHSSNAAASAIFAGPNPIPITSKKWSDIDESHLFLVNGL